MKSYTDLEQSKKLAEILPIESADMVITFDFDYRNNKYTPNKPNVEPYIKLYKEILVLFGKEETLKRVLPCWSLAALLDVLPFPQLSKDKLGSDKEGWMVSVYPDNCRYDSCWHDNPVDACYEMILKLHELNLL